MVHWDAIPKWFQILTSVVGLSATAGTVWNRGKQWVNPDNARKGNPELLTKYLELHEQIPRYVPAKDDLLATIQEMTLEIAEDPARVMQRRNSRFQIYCMWFGGFFIILGAVFVASAFLARVWFPAIPGGIIIVTGIVLSMIGPIGMDIAMRREAEQAKARRAAFKKDRSWPEKVDLPKPAKTRKRRSFLPGARRIRILRRARRLRNARRKRNLERAQASRTATGRSPDTTQGVSVTEHRK